MQLSGKHPNRKLLVDPVFTFFLVIRSDGTRLNALTVDASLSTDGLPPYYTTVVEKPTYISRLNWYDDSETKTDRRLCHLYQSVNDARRTNVRNVITIRFAGLCKADKYARNGWKQKKKINRNTCSSIDETSRSSLILKTGSFPSTTAVGFVRLFPVRPIFSKTNPTFGKLIANRVLLIRKSFFYFWRISKLGPELRGRR